MNYPEPNSIEILQHFSRRTTMAGLFLVAILGGTGLALILSPDGAAGRAATRAMWLIPVAIVIAVAATQSVLKKRRWNPNSAEVQTIVGDEWRRASLDRASRISLIVVLAAQWPLALFVAFSSALPPVRIAMAMATASLTLGLVTLLSLFLFFDRG